MDISFVRQRIQIFGCIYVNNKIHPVFYKWIWLKKRSGIWRSYIKGYASLLRCEAFGKSIGANSVTVQDPIEAEKTLVLTKAGSNFSVLKPTNP